ncbi:MAG TPA: hypothetical protein VM182_08585 [Terriglobia bacterium]|nr:hypothetical protein [Terriglobia bacterium]
MGADSGYERPPTNPIPKEMVLKWMASRDIQALGATYAFLFNKPERRNRVQPPLEYRDYHKFVTHYFERCFRENPDGKWTNNRYEAGWDLVNWFAFQWNDPEVPRSALDDLKSWMAKLYKEGDAELRRCFVDATLEHLFEQSKFRKFFADWKDDPVLKVAHAEALEWVKGGGNTPLGKPEGRRLLSGQLSKKRKR